MRRVAMLAVFAVLAAGCSSKAPEPRRPSLDAGVYKLGQPYQINGRWYYPSYDPNYRAVGIASWYGHPFHGRETANGEIFDRNRISAAHPTLPLPSLVRVTNLDNGRELVVRVNDRGPFVDERVIDLSQAAARELGFERRGLARVEVAFIGLADARGTPPAPTVVASASPPPVPRERPQPAAPPPIVQASYEPPGSCALGPAFVQVAALSDPARVSALARSLPPRMPVHIQPTMAGAQAVARVRVGPFEEPGQAQSALYELRAMGHGDAFLVPAGPATVTC